MNLIEQLEDILHCIKALSHPFELVIVTGNEASGKSTVMNYCNGARYTECDTHLGRLNLVGEEVTNDKAFNVIFQGQRIFFEWRVFQKEHHTIELFLLTHLIACAAKTSLLILVDNLSITTRYGASFKEFFSKMQDFIPPEAMASVSWIVTRFPTTLRYLKSEFIRSCRRIHSNFPAKNFFRLTCTDSGEAVTQLMEYITPLPLNSLSISVELNEFSKSLLKSALEADKTNVIELLLKTIDASKWLHYGLNKKDDAFVRQLAKVVVLRLIEPDDLNYCKLDMLLSDTIDALKETSLTQALKEARAVLDLYEKKGGLPEAAVLNLCQQLMSLISETTPEVKLLAEGAQSDPLLIAEDRGLSGEADQQYREEKQLQQLTELNTLSIAASPLDEFAVRYQQKQVPLATLLGILAQNIELGSKPRWTAGGSTSQKVQILRALETFVSNQDQSWIIDAVNQTKLLTLIKSICSTHRNWAPVHFGPPASFGEFLGLIKNTPEKYGTTVEAVSALKTVVLCSKQLSRAISTVDFNVLIDGIRVEPSCGTSIVR